VLTFRGLGAMPVEVLVQGLVVGASLMAGTFAGKAMVLRLSARAFQYMLDALLVGSGLALLLAAFQH
jgi:uncharacterized membrane protein YfcA